MSAVELVKCMHCSSMLNPKNVAKHLRKVHRLDKNGRRLPPAAKDRRKKYGYLVPILQKAEPKEEICPVCSGDGVSMEVATNVMEAVGCLPLHASHTRAARPLQGIEIIPGFQMRITLVQSLAHTIEIEMVVSAQIQSMMIFPMKEPPDHSANSDWFSRCATTLAGCAGCYN